jgi:hypothetical protein
MKLFRRARTWFRPSPAEVEAQAEASRLEEGKLTVRVSQSGRQPSVIVPTPDVLDPEREHR